LTLGPETEEYVVFYVDILISKSSEEHMIHLDLVLNKLTHAGCTINMAKCQCVNLCAVSLGNFLLRVLYLLKTSKEAPRWPTLYNGSFYLFVASAIFTVTFIIINFVDFFDAEYRDSVLERLGLSS
jgi:hypothetical protein